MFADGSTTPEFNTKGMGVTITDDESESSSESATGSQGQEVEQEVEIVPIPNAEFPEGDDFKAMYHEVVCTNKELNEEIEDNHKAMEEMRKEVKALMAKNPTLGANPDIIQNQHNEIKKLLAENDLLRKSQKPTQFHTSDELSTTSSEINDVIAPHRILGEIYKLIPTTRDHGDLKFRIEDGKIIGVEVINFAA
jgi:predicted nuclease with TOPRIM domain